MSLVTNPRSIIIENDDLCDDRFDAPMYSEDKSLFEALRNAHEVAYRLEKEASEPTKTRHSPLLSEATRPKRQQQEQPRQWQWRPKKPRRFDPKSVGRLIAPTATSRARSQKKYVDVLEEVKRQEKSVTPRSVSPVATKAGLRLYSSALAMRRRLEKMRAEQEEIKRRKEEKFSFQPRITSLAKTITRNGYKPPHERYNSTKEELAKSLLLREKERINQMTTGCTFHPTLTTASVKMIGVRRCNEPFDDVGERLFYDGGCRLIRQQLRKRILEQKADNDVIGAFQITQEAAGQLALRLMKWKEASNRNREAAQQEYIQRVSKPPFSRAEQARPQSQHGLQSSHCHQQQQHRKCHGLVLSSGAKASEQVVKDEFRRALYCALFYKYASSGKSEFVYLQDVKRQVRDLFPEDSSVVVALMANFGDSEGISKTAFADSLLRFENLNGPQPWGYPRSDYALSSFGTPPLLTLSSKTCQVQESNAEKKPGLRRSNSAHSVSSGKKDHALSHVSLSHPSRSTTLGESFSKNVLKCSGSYAKQMNQGDRVAAGTAKKLVGGHSAYLCTSARGRQSVEKHETQSCQEEVEGALPKERHILQRTSSLQRLSKPSLSPESVEVSSMTEDCHDTPKLKQAEDIAAELEALLATPVERSVTASPDKRVDVHARGVNGGTVFAVSSSRKRGGRTAPVSGCVGSGSFSGARKGYFDPKQLLKEVTSVLNAKNVHVELDPHMTTRFREY